MRRRRGRVRAPASCRGAGRGGRQRRAGLPHRRDGGRHRPDRRRSRSPTATSGSTRRLVNTVCNFDSASPCSGPGVTLIPSCGGLGDFSTCATPDAGVFRVANTGTGVAGTACAGMGFTITEIDAALRPAALHARRGPERHARRRGHRLPRRVHVRRDRRTGRRPELGAGPPDRPGGRQHAARRGRRAHGFGPRLQRRDHDPARAARDRHGGVAGRGARRAGHRHGGRQRPGQPRRGRDRRLPALRARRRDVRGRARVPVARRGRSTRTAARPRSRSRRPRRAPTAGARSTAATPTTSRSSGACNDANENVAVTPPARPPRITVNDTPGQGGRCTESNFRLRVNARATGLKSVRVTLDGKTIARSKQGKFTVRVRAAAKKFGRHVIRIIATGAGGRTVRVLEFQRCGRPLSAAVRGLTPLRRRVVASAPTGAGARGSSARNRRRGRET